MSTLPTTVDTISAAGYERLCAELEMLRTEARQTLSELLREARHDGDLEDNPALRDLLEEQAQLEQRISLLDAQRRAAEIVEPDSSGRAGIGTSVQVRDLDTGSRHEYELVGALEPDVGNGRVSVEAPVGRALLGRVAGDRLGVETPRGVIELEVLAVRLTTEARPRRRAA